MRCDVTPTSNDNVGAIVTAGVVNTGATGTDGGSIGGGVIDGLFGLAVVGFIVTFVFVTLFSFSHHGNSVVQGKGAAVLCPTNLTLAFSTTPRFLLRNFPSRLPGMSETSGHASSPSVSTVEGPGIAGFSTAGGGATPPSQALAAAAVLQERPKYVYSRPQRRCWWSTRPG